MIEQRRKARSWPPLKTILVLVAIGGVAYFFGAMPDLPHEPIGKNAITTRAFTDPNGKASCDLPVGTRVNIVNGSYEDSFKNRWSIAHDKYGRPEVGDFTAYVPITPTHTGCARAIQLHPREFVVDPKVTAINP
jgi:hypothetical protein